MTSPSKRTGQIVRLDYKFVCKQLIDFICYFVCLLDLCFQKIWKYELKWALLVLP